MMIMELPKNEHRGDIGGVSAYDALGLGFERQLTFGECETIAEREEDAGNELLRRRGFLR